MKLDTLTEEELKDLVLKKQLEYIKLCQDNFLVFVENVWQDFIYRKDTSKLGKGHHEIIANAFHDIADGDAKRLIINMPPRHTKSEFASYLFLLGILESIQRKK